MTDIYPNKRFVALEWGDASRPWQNVLVELDANLEKVSSICVDFVKIYFLFGLPGIFVARSVTGGLPEYLLGGFKTVDFRRGAVDFDEFEAEGLLGDDRRYFAMLEAPEGKGFVEIVQKIKDNVSSYVLRKSKVGPLTLNIL